jgi:hypothetical protein
MADWTAKIDLNLIVDDRAGLTPTVSFIDLRDTAVIPKVGSIMQNFSFGLGAGANTTATRNDSLSFTLSLKEIRQKTHALCVRRAAGPWSCRRLGSARVDCVLA